MAEQQSKTGMVLGIVGAVFGVLILGIAASWMIQGSNWFMYDVFAPKYEETRRKTFEESKAYNEGMVQELQNMQFEYVKADDDHKEALADIILHRAADFDEEEMPKDLREFVQELKKKKLEAK